MKSVFSFTVMALMIVMFFQGMLIVFDDADKTNLDPDSQELYETLVINLNEVQPVDPNTGTSQINFTRDNPQISDENAFSAEFFTASTSNQDKVSNLDAMKNTPQLIMFTVGQEESFGWFYDYWKWFVGLLIALIGFTVLFRREVFN